MALLRSEYLGKLSSELPSLSCTRKVASLAPDEIESGWLRHACALFHAPSDAQLLLARLLAVRCTDVYVEPVLLGCE